MTSKELLKHIKNAPSFMGGDNRYMGVIGSNILYSQDIELLQKDLDVLELLKPYFVITENGWYIDLDNYCFDTNGKENKTIKEWLDNGK